MTINIVALYAIFAVCAMFNSKVMMTNLRERRRLRTTDTIRRAAIDLIYALGLDNVTTEMISEKAGISSRTFFNYFPYKEAALIPPEQEFSLEAIDKFVNGSATLLDDLADLIVPFAEPYGKDPEILRKLFEISETHPKLVMLKVNVFHDFDQKLATVLALRIKDGVQKPDLVAALISTTMRVALARWAESGSGVVSEHIRQSLQELRTAFND